MCIVMGARGFRHRGAMTTANQRLHVRRHPPPDPGDKGLCDGVRRHVLRGDLGADVLDMGELRTSSRAAVVWHALEARCATHHDDLAPPALNHLR